MPARAHRGRLGYQNELQVINLQRNAFIGSNVRGSALCFNDELHAICDVSCAGTKGGYSCVAPPITGNMACWSSFSCMATQMPTWPRSTSAEPRATLTSSSFLSLLNDTHAHANVKEDNKGDKNDNDDKAAGKEVQDDDKGGESG